MRDGPRVTHDRDPEWKRLLEPVVRAAARQQPATRYALSCALFADEERGWFYSQTLTPLERDRLEAGDAWFVGVRPVEAGARPGTYRRGGLTWRSFAQRGRGPDEPVRALLDQVHRLSRDEQNLNPGDAGVLRLDRYPSPLLWTLLDRLARAGVPLVGEGLLTGVQLGERATKRFDLHRDSHGRVHVQPQVRIDGQEADAFSLVGTHGFAALNGDLGTPGAALQLTLAPLEQPVRADEVEVMRRSAPLVIDAQDTTEFTEEFYPVLRRVAPVTSEDETVDLPERRPPRLSLLVVFGEDDTAELHWSWRYTGPRRDLPILPLGAGTEDALRDTAAEAAVRSRVAPLWPGAGTVEREDLSGVPTAEFAIRVLPRLEALDCLHVEVSGARPDYRELTEPPTVTVTSEESETYDWFDLAFQVTVAGRTVPFATLFRALARGQKTLLLTDKSLLSLDHPAFDRLKELLDRAQAVGEWDPRAPKISRVQVSLWEDFVDAADHSSEAVAWRQTVAALRGLTELPQPEVPAGLTAELRDYQLEGFAWLSLLHDHGLGGILADDMGLGKTVQTLALIVRAREKAREVAHEAAQDAAEGAGPAGRPPFLVVAPASVVGVWRSEAARFAAGLDVRVIDATRARRRTELSDEVAGADIVVTSYALLRLDADDYAGLGWDGLIVDEAQFAKNRTTQVHDALGRIRAPFRLAITGTPVENSLDDLWALLSLTAPGLFPSPVSFREHFTKPLTRGDAPHRMALLQRRIRPFVLRRTKEQVVRELPPKQEQVRMVQLLPEHRRVYDAVLQRERKKVLGLLDDLREPGMDRGRFIVFRSLTLLRMLALDPAIVDGQQHAGITSSKLHALLEDLERVLGENHRVLVFSQFTSFLDRVGEALTVRGVEHVRLDGATRRREEVVERFRSGGAGVFLLSLKAGGLGLTLTEADYVFLMDPWWNPAAESQAIDRVHRIGQEASVLVYRMVAAGTIEEKVLDLQRRKTALTDALWGDGQNGFAQALTADDIRGLLEG
ncbi:DEAD/DEAH box helicase [Brevibacterium senegalense]|uniref:DEAD/DEAH box helicase n=1 Tax=Brevibacterium senegalense TaxID=1033736 RepID=UPI0002F1C17F|nr:DEAD/DEAH box helicase [Brevibacterium senegalense]